MDRNTDGRSAGNHFMDCLVPQLLAERPEIARRVDAVIGVELTGEGGGYWTLDLTSAPSIRKGKTKEPAGTLSADVDVFESLVAGASVRDCLEAFKKKRIRATGHLPTILKLEILVRSIGRDKL